MSVNIKPDSESSGIVKPGVAGLITAFVLAWFSTWESGGSPILTPYKDPVGVWTVCNGITNMGYPGFVVPGKKYTVQECHDAETHVLQKQVLPALTKCRKHYVTQRQHDILVDFAWGTGTETLCRSTLMRKLNAGDCYGAADEFQKWKYASDGRGEKVILRGILKRRAWQEREFREGCAVWDQIEAQKAGTGSRAASAASSTSSKILLHSREAPSTDPRLRIPP